MKWDEDNWWDKSDCPHFFPSPKYPGLVQKQEIQQNVCQEIKGIIGLALTFIGKTKGLVPCCGEENKLSWNVNQHEGGEV